MESKIEEIKKVDNYTNKICFDTDQFKDGAYSKFLIELKEGLKDKEFSKDKKLDILTSFGLASRRPFSYQVTTVNAMLEHEKLFVWNDMGTGKTFCCILYYLYLCKKLNKKLRLLVLAPKTPCYDAWQREFLFAAPHKKLSMCLGSAKKKKKAIAHAIANDGILISNLDSVRILEDEFVVYKPDILIVDESTAFKKLRTRRSMSLRYLVDEVNIPRILFMSGSAFSQTPFDLFAQALVICPYLVTTDTVFKSKIATPIQDAPYWQVKPDYCEPLKEMIDPVIRFSRDECLDLPDIQYITINAGMSKQQVDVYNSLQKTAKALLVSGEPITVANAGVLYSKLLQCCGGNIYIKVKNEAYIEIKPDELANMPTEEISSLIQKNKPFKTETRSLEPVERLEAVKDLIDGTDHGVIVFSQFKNSIYALTDYLSKYFSCVAVCGATKVEERTEIINKFQNKEIKVIVAHAQTMGHGITLTEADTIIWYAPTSNLEHYEQANSRMIRIGQKKKMCVYTILSTRFEALLVEKLIKKQSLKTLLFEAFDSGTGDEAITNVQREISGAFSDLGFVNEKEEEQNNERYA